MHFNVHENIMNPGEDAKPATNFSVIAMSRVLVKIIGSESEPNFGNLHRGAENLPHLITSRICLSKSLNFTESYSKTFF